MKKTLIKTTLQMVLGAVSFAVLFNLSGCVTDILGVDTEYTPWCEVDFTIQGPDAIFIDPTCKPTEVSYQLFLDSQFKDIVPSNAGWNFTWVVNGDLEVVSAGDPNPLIVIPPMEITDPNGVQFAEISAVADNTYDECGEEGVPTTYATKSIAIFANVLDVESTVCSVQGSLGNGKLEVVGDKALGDKVYQWSIFPEDAAIITPEPGTNRCDVKDAKSDFKVRVEKLANGCVNEIYKDIQICIVK